MKRIMKMIGGASAIMAATVAQAAAAEICLPFIGCITIGGGGGGAPQAPEIDVSQGFAALAIVAVAGFLLREMFNRERKAR